MLKLTVTPETVHVKYYTENLKGRDHLANLDITGDNIKLNVNAI
jgi:hypothetical protein